MQQNHSFDELGLSENLLKSVKKKGFEEPTPIQAQVIPTLMKSEKDVVGQAQTGTGKTAAFGLPIMDRIVSDEKRVKTLILTPTRELAIQVSEELNSLKGKKKLKIVPIYGGQSIELQLKRLTSGADIVVGTPGRVIDHLNRRTLDISKLDYLVLDEADEMLNMGFIEDIESILKRANPDKRMLLFSATMPREILNIAKRFMGEYEVFRTKSEELAAGLTEQIYFEVRETDKFEALCRIRDMEKEFYGIIFCRTKVDVDRLANKLIDRGYNAEALHGDISQHQRERILKKFRNKQVNMLVATDVAARGIDIQDLTHVINYALPQDPDAYIHRIGRTGRAGKEGTAITFVTPEEYRKLLFIMRKAKTDIRKESLPGVGEIIKAKKDNIKEEINSVVNSGDLESYYEIAENLLENNDPLKVVSGLLSIAYEDELNEDSYKEISSVNINKQGRSRLFVALGKIDGMSPKSLVEFIIDKAGVENKTIKDVKVFEKFSFITVPFEESEIILEIFKREKRGRRPIVEIAKERKK